jgi:phosphate/sulfate permease
MIKNKIAIYNDLLLLKDYSREFLKHPVEKIKTVPKVSWESTVVGIFGINIICGILRAFYQFSVINFLISLFITPIIAAMTLVLLSLFIYYFFQTVFKETYNYEKICTILFLAYVPGAVFYLGSVFYPPLFILGLTVNSVLVVVGLEENLHLPQKTIIKLVSLGFVLAMIFWIMNQFFSHRVSMDPKSMDQMEEEISEMK